MVRPPAVHPLPFPYLEGQSINILMGRNCRAFTLYCGGRSRCRRIKSPPFFRGLFSLNALACLSSSLLDPYILFLPSFIFLSRFSSFTHALQRLFCEWMCAARRKRAENDVFRMRSLKSLSIHPTFWKQIANATVPPLKLTDYRMKRVVRWENEYMLFRGWGGKPQTLFSGRLKNFSSWKNSIMWLLVIRTKPSISQLLQPLL